LTVELKAMPVRSTWIVVLALVACVSSCTSAGPAAQRPVPRRHVAQRYVALGDSYTSGPLIPDHAVSGCLRSSHDYPALVAAVIHPASFTDASCDGATTASMTHAQTILGHTAAPQLAALSPDDTLVTVQIGGNDIGFGSIVATCAILSLTDLSGSPCAKHYASGGTGRLARAIARAAPKVAAVFRGIRRRAPHARVLLVGYPDILPASGDGCWPQVPVASGDIAYLRGVEADLNRMLAAEATSHGTTYVNTYADSTGHDACQGPGVRWIEGLVPTSVALSFHPNEAGERAMARQVLDALR
jgi:lysophospholipase L1-like esterase